MANIKGIIVEIGGDTEDFPEPTPPQQSPED